jgi:hypothetical protein
LHEPEEKQWTGFSFLSFFLIFRFIGRLGFLSLLLLFDFIVSFFYIKRKIDSSAWI